MSLIRDAAADEGFMMCGVSSAVASPGHPDLVQWIESGYAGQMAYFAERLDAYRHPSAVLAGAKSIVALAFPYSAGPRTPLSRGQGAVARYAWSGDDYHDVIHPKLKRLCGVVGSQIPDANARGVVDTAPLMEREVAQLAGLGWRAKNTLLINTGLGSYFFLACVLTDVDLPADRPHETAHCGTCTACLDACPTDAFVKPSVMDASRCISYLTIEHRGPIDIGLRESIGDWVFGCDVCQDVCPWNRKPAVRESGSESPWQTIELAELFSMGDEEFRSRFRRTPMWRTRRRGMLRNAAIVLGNQRDPSTIDALSRGLSDNEAIVRGASAWALGRIVGAPAKSLLRDRLAQETDVEVIAEINDALA